MGVPEAVKKAAAQADAAHKEVYRAEESVQEPEQAGEKAQATPGEANGATTTVSDYKPEQEVVAQKVEGSPNTKDRDDSGTWEQRYKTLQGMWRKDVPTLQAQNAELQDKMADLQRKLADMEVAKEEQQVSEATKFVTDADRADFGDDMLEIVRRAAKEEFMPELSRIKAENRRLQERVNGFGSTLVESERQKLLNVLDNDIPNWREVNEMPEFMEWLKARDPYSGQVKHTLLKEAFAANDVQRMKVFFQDFLGNNTGAVAATTEVRGNPVDTIDADTLVAPGTPRTTGGGSRSKQESSRIWTDKSIAAFYDDCVRGKYKTDKQLAEKRRIEQDIIRAQSEGRIRQGFIPPMG